ncbi:MAG: GTP cyclohydrolase I FolE [Verrucomicrobia bacterium]|nr:MAG: GTP cyclohydrolase I FolE [Verrucomicrobiota bacterium]
MNEGKHPADRLADAVRTILKELGEDPSREGLQRTPHRAAQAFRFLTRGYAQDPRQIIESAIFASESRDMIIVKDIEIYSLCEHHLLPFYGRCHIGYVPDGRVVGVSKLARLADAYARRLQQQERLTHQIAAALMDALQPIGVGVVIEARHLCMMMRGVEKQNSAMVTSAMLGHFRSSMATRSEFLQLIGRPSPS